MNIPKHNAPSELRKFGRHRGGFTLIEVMVVIAIIGILAVSAAPSIMSLRNQYISQSGQELDNEFDFARQTALTENSYVEVRFYMLNGHFQALQSFGISSVGQLVPLDPVVYLPANTIIDSGSISSLVNQPSRPIQSPSGNDPSLPVYGTSYQYTYFCFKPDGSTDLSLTSSWFVSVHSVSYGDPVSSSSLPSNYYTVQLDPYNGHPYDFRP